MKKIILTVFSLFIIMGILQAQEESRLSNYLSVSTGYSPHKSSFNSKSKYSISAEYGKRYKWLEVGISFDYINGLSPKIIGEEAYHFNLIRHDKRYDMLSEKSFYGTKVTALSLNSRIDLIRLLTPNSNHSVKVGGFFGMGFMEDFNMQHETNEGTEVSWYYNASYEAHIGGRISYEYSIKSHSLGLFYQTGKIYGISYGYNF